MLNIDIRTLSFLAMITSLLLAAGLILVSRVLSKDTSVRFWAWGTTANGAGYILLALRGMIPDLLSIVAANTLLLAGMVWLYLGNRNFQGCKKGIPWHWPVATIGTLALFYFTYITPNLSARIVVFSIAAAVLLFSCALVFLSTGDRSDRVMRGFVALTYLSIAFFMAARAVMTILIGTTGQDFMALATPINTLALVFGIGLNVVLGIGLPLLVSGRMQRKLIDSEERYRTMYKKTLAIMHSIDADGVLINVSDLWLSTFGYTHDEVIGRQSSDFLTEESRRYANETVLPEFLRTGVCTDVAYQFVTKDGRILDMLLSASVERDRNNRIVRSLAVMNDVTARNRIESALVESELQFRGAFEAAAHGMALVSTDGRFLKVNTALCTMLGYAASELLATDFQSITHPEDLAADLHHVQDLLAGRSEIYHMEKRYFHKSGHILWILLSVSLARTKNGTPIHFVSQIQDITEARNASARLQTLLDTASDGVHVLDAEGNIVQFSPSFARMLGYPVDELARLNVRDWDAKISHEKIIPGIQSLIEKPSSFETVHRRKDGSTFDVEINAKGVMLDGNRYLYASSRDITERKLNQQRLEHLLAQQKAMLENDLVGIVTIKNYMIVWANPAFEKMLGYAPGELNDKPTRINYANEETYLSTCMASAPVLASGNVFSVQLEYVRKDGSHIWVDTSGSMLDRDSGESLWTAIDITERKNNEAKIHALAFYDPLTQLPNRRLLLDRLGLALPGSARRNTHAAILFLDLDNFKILNDTKGHEFGDLLLAEAARRMQSCVRAEDTVARTGGDEFVIMLENLSSEVSLATAQVETIARKIREVLAIDYQLPQQTTHHCTCSIGITVFKGNEIKVADLIKRADNAMYQAKAAGRNAIRHFDPHANAVLEHVSE